MRAIPFVLAAVLGVAAAALVSCGGTASRRDLIPPGSADRMKSALSDVRSAVDSGDCAGAARALTRARGALVSLPSSVDDRLVARLRQGISRLEALAPRQCAQQDTQTTTVQTTETTTPETTTTQTPTTDTTPTTSTTTPTDTTPTATTPPTTTTTTPAPDTAAPPADTTGGAPTP
jgi:cell division septation protein DedD